MSKELPEHKNTRACDSVTEIPPVWNSCCSGKKWKVKCCLSSPISLHTSLWCCTNQSWPAVYRIRRLNASRGGPCKYVCWESSPVCGVEHSVIICFLNDRKWNAAWAVVTRGTCWWWVWQTVVTHLMPRFSHRKTILFAWCTGRAKPVRTVWSERCFSWVRCWTGINFWWLLSNIETKLQFTKLQY